MTSDPFWLLGVSREEMKRLAADTTRKMDEAMGATSWSTTAAIDAVTQLAEIEASVKGRVPATVRVEALAHEEASALDSRREIRGQQAGEEVDIERVVREEVEASGQVRREE